MILNAILLSYVVLAGACIGIFFSLSVIVSKTLLPKAGTVVVTWGLFALSLPILFVVAFWSGIPAVTPVFFIGAGGSAAVFVFAKLIEMRSIKIQSLHLVYPLTIFSTVFTYILGLIVFHEVISPVAVVGMAVTLVGAYILNVEKSKEGIFEPFIYLIRDKFSLLVLLAMLLTAISSVLDKTALLHIQGANAGATLFVENLLMSGFLTIILFRRERAWLKEVKKYFWPLLLMSVLYVITGVFTFQAFAGGTVALTSAVKRTAVLWVMVYGVLFFHERPPRHVWVATILMICGVMLIRLG